MAGGKIGSNKAQIIPEANLTKVLSFDEASRQLEDFNRHVVQGGMSLDTYFKQYQNGNTVLKNYVTTTEQQKQSTQGLIKASQDARNAQLAHNEAIRNSTLSAKAATVATKALAIAGNMLLFTAITKGIQLAVTAIDNYIHRVEKSQETLQESVSSFESVTKEVDELNEELKTCNERIDKLQKLADNGTISIADANELELLKQTNDELERKIALKQAEQIHAQKEVLRDNDKLLNTKVRSSYSYTDVHLSGGRQTAAESVLPEEELALAINKYKELSKILSDKSLQEGEKKSIQGQLEYASEKIHKMYDIISPSIDAYNSLIDAGYELSGAEKARYDSLRQYESEYLAYNYNINGTKEAFIGLNKEQQKNILLNRLSAQGLSAVQAESVLRNISEDDYKNFWDKDFSFTPPEMSGYADAEEYGRAYAEAWLEGLKTVIESADKAPLSLGNIEH